MLIAKSWLTACLSWSFQQETSISASKRYSSISSILLCCRKISKSLKINLVTQSEAKIRSHKKWQDRIRRFKDWCYFQSWIRCENNWSCVGWILGQESTLDVDTNVHVLLSNIELRQNEWRNRYKYRIDDKRRRTVIEKEDNQEKK